MITKMAKIVLALVLVFGVAGFVFSQDENEKLAPPGVMKEVEGKVAGIDKDYIAISYSQDLEKGIEYEILLPIEKDIKLEHKDSLDQIALRDTVRVQYEEVTEEDAEGHKKMIRTAKVISFVKPAEKRPEITRVEGSPLPLKGTKER